MDIPWGEAIVEVLADAGTEGMHYTDIAAAVQERGLRESVGATPAASVATYLSTALRDRVERVSRGTYRLPPLTPAAASTSQVSEPDLEPPSNMTEVAQVAAEDAEESGLINAFGMFWLRSEVSWKEARPPIWGQSQPRASRVDFHGQEGIYILYDGPRIIYVGRTTTGNLGARLRAHTEDRLRSRWDRFSWFGVKPVRQDGQLADATQTGIDLNTLIATMEALLIEGLEPPQNRRQGDGFAAIEYVQVVDDNVRKRHLQRLIADLG